jgi:hypothetical protein
VASYNLYYNLFTYTHSTQKFGGAGGGGGLYGGGGGCYGGGGGGSSYLLPYSYGENATVNASAFAPAEATFSVRDSTQVGILLTLPSPLSYYWSAVQILPLRCQLLNSY